MATSRFIIKKKYLKRNGRTPVYIQYIFVSDEKLLINTGHEIMPEHWNPVTQSIKEKAGTTYGKNFALINSELYSLMNAFKHFLGATLDRQLVPTIKFVKDHFKEYITNREQASKPIPDKLVDIYDHIRDYIQIKKNEVAKDTVKDYNSLIRHLNQFEKSKGKKIDFTSFDYNFYDEFVDFLFYETEKPDGEKGLLANSVGKQIKNLKAFLSRDSDHVDPAFRDVDPPAEQAIKVRAS